MDRNALMLAARARFLDAFLLATDDCLAASNSPGWHRHNPSAAATGQRAMLQASHLLLQSQADLRGYIRQRMEQLLDRSFQTTYSTFRPSFSKEFTSDKLTLIDFTQLENQLLIDEITTRFRNASDHALRDLNVRIAFLFEQKTIKERENPFRPWLFTQCIVSAIEALGARPEVTAILCRQIASKLESKVASLYEGVNSYLAEQGIAAQLQLSRPCGGATPPPSPVGAPTQLYGVHPGTASQPDRPVSAALLQAMQTLHAAPAPKVSEVLEVPGMAHIEAASLHNRVQAARTLLHEATHDDNERTTIDTVAALLNYILDDERIDYAIRAQLGRLQLRILETALREPAFLALSTHPLRALVNGLGTMSIGASSATLQNARVEDGGESGKAIGIGIGQIVDDFLAGSSARLISSCTLLSDLETLIARQFVEKTAQNAHAAKVLEEAQRWLLHFTRLEAQLDNALSGLIIDPFLRDFLMHTWTRVIDHVERQPATAQSTAMQYRQLVPDLLWSIVPPNSPQRRTQLLALLPALARSLRDGFAAIAWGTERQQTILDWLMQAHRGVLRDNRQSAHSLSLEAVHKHFQQFVSAETASGMPDTVTTPYTASQRHYLDYAIRQIDLRLRTTMALDGKGMQRLRFVQRLPLFEQAMESIADGFGVAKVAQVASAVDAPPSGG